MESSHPQGKSASQSECSSLLSLPTLRYGGKFGVLSDRQDKSAVGWEHIEKVNKHDSQKDYKTGFGGKERII